MKFNRSCFVSLFLVPSVGVLASCTTPAAPVKGCDDPRPVLVNGAESGLVVCTGGVTHRSTIEACPTFEPEAGACPMDPMHPEWCAANADCTQHPGMACAPSNDANPCGCLNTCVNDVDCGPGRMCRCDGRVAFCELARCLNDAACPAGRLCVLTDFVSCEPGQRQGFACQSELDECLTSLDCPDQQQCGYAGDHRICVKQLCAM
jgi:hypothetical protein